MYCTLRARPMGNESRAAKHLGAAAVAAALLAPLGAQEVGGPPGHRPDEGTPAAEEVARALSEWLPPRLKELEIPAAASAVVDRDGVVWEATFGSVDGGDSRPVTADTLFCVRSIAKSVTALGVLVAVQDGLVELDVPIGKYLPGFSVHSRFEERPEERITLRRMLSHWAGFAHDPPAGLRLDRPGYYERYVGRISDSWLRAPVGHRMVYANYGVDLAGYVLQARSGVKFAEYMRKRVLLPLGMNGSTFDPALVERREDRAVGYDAARRAVPVRFPEVAAAGLFASVRDLSAFARFHLNGGVVDGRRLLREDLMAEYHAIQFPRSGQRTGYCLGLWREVVGSTYSLYHEGGGRGFGSHLILYPELGVGAVTLTNVEYQGLTGEEGRRVMNAPIQRRLGPTPVAEPGAALRAVDLDDPASEARVAGVLGRYGDSPGARVARDERGLVLSLDGGAPVPLTLFDDGGELVGAFERTMEARFLSPFGGRRGALMLVDRGVSNPNCHYLEFNDSPADPPGPDERAWREHVGEYDVLWEGEPFTTVSVTTTNGYLYFRDGKCVELEPGLFSLYDGETLDLRSVPMTYAALEIRRKDP